MWGAAPAGTLPWGALAIPVVLEPPEPAVEGGEVLEAPGRTTTAPASARSIVLQAPARAVLLEVK